MLPVGELALIQNADGYDEVSARVKPSADGIWDLPNNSRVTVLDEWVECEFAKLGVGYIKAKNLPGSAVAAKGDMLEVKDSYPANKETCMRRHAEQDSSKGNVLGFVRNGPAYKVQFVERWVEFQWKALHGFVKARHVQAIDGAELPPEAADDAEPPPKRARTGPEGMPAARRGAGPAAPAPEGAGAPEDAPEPADAAPEIAAPAIPEVAAAPLGAAPPPGAAEAAAAAGGDTRDCGCCFDSVEASTGCACPGKEHFFCASCLANLLTAFKTADFAEQKKGKGRALCPMKDSEAAFSDGALAALVAQDVFDDYLQIRLSVAEKTIQEQMEKENTDKIKELKEKLAKATGDEKTHELDKYRLHIIDDIFTLKCPQCKMAFFDYDGCSAVTCSGCQCGFCSFCLMDCGKDAHQHFYSNKSKCPSSGMPLFVKQSQWREHQCKRKEKLINKYMRQIPEDLRQAVCDMIAPDAKDLGIQLPADLSTEALSSDVVCLLLTVPHVLRKGLVSKKASLELKASLKFTIPTQQPRASSKIMLRKEPKKSLGANAMASVKLGEVVNIDDDWVKVACPSQKIAKAWVKRKHVAECTLVPQALTKLRDAGGHGSVLLRKNCTQEEGANALKFVSDDTVVKIIERWFEVVHNGERGFAWQDVLAEDDVTLEGPSTDCYAAVEKIEEVLGFGVEPKEISPPDHVAGKGRGRGRGRGRG